MPRCCRGLTEALAQVTLSAASPLLPKLAPSQLSLRGETEAKRHWGALLRQTYWSLQGRPRAPLWHLNQPSSAGRTGPGHLCSASQESPLVPQVHALAMLQASRLPDHLPSWPVLTVTIHEPRFLLRRPSPPLGLRHVIGEEVVGRPHAARSGPRHPPICIPKRSRRWRMRRGLGLRLWLSGRMTLPEERSLEHVPGSFILSPRSRRQHMRACRNCSPVFQAPSMDTHGGLLQDLLLRMQYCGSHWCSCPGLLRRWPRPLRVEGHELCCRSCRAWQSGNRSRSASIVAPRSHICRCPASGRSSRSRRSLRSIRHCSGILKVGLCRRSGALCCFFGKMRETRGNCSHRCRHLGDEPCSTLLRSSVGAVGALGARTLDALRAKGRQSKGPQHGFPSLCCGSTASR
mmetsp:Transcript_40720/g.88981  ORF Transcript_40720/g.88981 Transcript_40720/m.88981 type:complete len:403 (-) Transcript_40720:321-1529(-)